MGDGAGPCVVICGGGFCLLVVVTIITVLASIKKIEREEQLVVEYLSGKEVLDGPQTKVVNPFRDKARRKLPRLSNIQYVVVKNTLDGNKSVHVGPALVKLQAYDELEGKIQQMVTLTREQYIVYVDDLSGEERIERGPKSVYPGAYERSEGGRQNAAFVNQDTAVLVMNKVTGKQRLIHPPSTAAVPLPTGIEGEHVEAIEGLGVYFPEKYEVVLDRRTLNRVAPTEAMVYRSHRGRYVVVSGAAGAGNGAAFFLPPFCEIVRMQWSSFSAASGFEAQTISQIEVERIDTRAKKDYFQYEVRTNDNVNIRVRGMLYWKVADVTTMIGTTSDPVGDVWHHARAALISVVSNNTLEEFINNVKAIENRAEEIQKTDGFYAHRGIFVENMEIIAYECVDEEVANTLYLTSQASVNRITAMQAQQSENDVAHATMDADIALEKTKEQFIIQQAANDKLRAVKEGEAEGTRIATGATTFIEGLEESLPDLDIRVELYRLHKKLENQNMKTRQLASFGKATLFLSPEDMALNLSYGTDM